MDLSDIELNKLREFYARYEDIEEVILYGSRAKGNHKPFFGRGYIFGGGKLDT